MPPPGPTPSAQTSPARSTTDRPRRYVLACPLMAINVYFSTCYLRGNIWAPARVRRAPGCRRVLRPWRWLGTGIPRGEGTCRAQSERPKRALRHLTRCRKSRPTSRRGLNDLGGLKRRGGSGRHGTRRQRDRPRHSRGWSSCAFTQGLTSRHGDYKRAGNDKIAPRDGDLARGIDRHGSHGADADHREGR